MPDDEVVVEAPETEVTDESTNTTVIITPPPVDPDPEPEAPAEVVDQHARTEAARAHERLDTLITEMSAAVAEEEAEDERVPDAPVETVVEDTQTETPEGEPQAAASGHRFPGWL